MKCLSFCVWLISLSIVYSRSVHAAYRGFFLFEQYPTVCLHYIFSIHPWMNTQVVSISWLLWTKSYHLTPVRIAQKKKKKTTHVGKDVENMEISCTDDGNVKWCSCHGKQYGDSLKTELPCNPGISFQGIYSKEMKQILHSHVH